MSALTADDLSAAIVLLDSNRAKLRSTLDLPAANLEPAHAERIKRYLAEDDARIARFRAALQEVSRAEGYARA